MNYHSRYARITSSEFFLSEVSKKKNMVNKTLQMDDRLRYFHENLKRPEYHGDCMTGYV